MYFVVIYFVFSFPGYQKRRFRIIPPPLPRKKNDYKPSVFSPMIIFFYSYMSSVKIRITLAGRRGTDIVFFTSKIQETDWLFYFDRTRLKTNVTQAITFAMIRKKKSLAISFFLFLWWTHWHKRTKKKKDPTKKMTLKYKRRRSRQVSFHTHSLVVGCIWKNYIYQWYFTSVRALRSKYFCQRCL